MEREQKDAIFIDHRVKRIFGKELYIKERDRLLDGTQPFPSPYFCQEFLNRLEVGLVLAEEEHESICDSVDYEAWGYALFGYLESAEQQVGDMDLWDWIYFYEAVKDKKLADAIDNITEILE